MVLNGLKIYVLMKNLKSLSKLKKTMMKKAMMDIFLKQMFNIIKDFINS